MSWSWGCHFWGSNKSCSIFIHGWISKSYLYSRSLLCWAPGLCFHIFVRGSQSASGIDNWYLQLFWWKLNWSFWPNHRKLWVLIYQHGSICSRRLHIWDYRYSWNKELITIIHLDFGVSLPHCNSVSCLKSFCWWNLRSQRPYRILNMGLFNSCFEQYSRRLWPIWYQFLQWWRNRDNPWSWSLRSKQGDLTNHHEVYRRCHKEGKLSNQLQSFLHKLCGNHICKNNDSVYNFSSRSLWFSSQCNAFCFD